ncbi:hypothetical protein [Chryseobacterium sp. VAUSW3]|uniref:hypothetical protein n=1 Tax=Chryseobacterium sp. VAUSW3 TaxID=2010998 RepID=UPI000B4D2977|nr:hypothetical protein [Chryseobacterium sp. VAUSW3]OWR13782.1 hypothetical protein CDW55_05395 [Chryseobacterium sp. VAUSW3]
MKTVAYIELDTHAEIARNFMDLMQDSNDFSVDYYFSKKISKHFGQTADKIFVAESSDIFNILKEKNYDLVIIGTVHRYFDAFLKISNKFNTSVIVHNLNFTKISRFQLLKNIFKKDFKYRLKLLLKEDLLSAPKVFEKASNLLVLDESLIKKNPDLSLKFLPVFYLLKYEKSRKSIITIVIPGAVSQQRRDYLHVLNSLKNFQRKSHYQFVFLGKASGQELSWLKDFEKHKPHNISVKYFTEKVPQLVFDEWMQKADLLWCPLKKETEFFSQKESYGITKMSGNIGDAIKYGKLAIFPENYPNSQPFIIPENENIEEQIYTYQKWMDYDFREHFAKGTVLKSLEKMLAKFL